MNQVLDLLLGIGKAIRQAINQSAEDWAILVERHPVGAASLLDLAAARLEGRAAAFRNKKGWRARRNKEVAQRLRQEAIQLKLHASLGLKCPASAKVAPWKSGA